MKAGTKHTPGPWKVGRTITESEPNLVARGVNGDGKMVYGAMIEAPSYFVAAVGGVGKEECLANAQLIAAAPEMLEAAELMWAFYQDLANSNPGFMGKLCLQDYAQWNQALMKLPAAIAKAKGIE